MTKGLISCYCGYERPEVYRATRPIARKDHRCSECGGKIAQGERYENVFGVWDGYPDLIKTCVYCLAARDLVESRIECFCWEHNNLLENIIETIRDSNDTPGLQMAVGRILIEGKRARRKHAS